MTEEEAKTKWCPQYRVASANGFTMDNRSPNDPPLVFQRYHCIGSACMAWRWRQMQTNEEREGFCGLAGKP